MHVLPEDPNSIQVKKELFDQAQSHQGCFYQGECLSVSPPFNICEKFPVKNKFKNFSNFNS